MNPENSSNFSTSMSTLSSEDSTIYITNEDIVFADTVFVYRVLRRFRKRYRDHRRAKNAINAHDNQLSTDELGRGGFVKLVILSWIL